MTRLSDGETPGGPRNAAAHGPAAPAVERPADAAQLAAVLAQAGAEGLGVCVAGGATKVGWGGRPERFDLLVDTRGLISTCEVDADDLTMTVSAGVTVADARARARAQGRILPLDAGCPGGATIGGATATGDQGARGTGWGRIRDLVLGLRVVLAEGTAVRFGGRTMKNVAGYDMCKLFVGSFGVLGVLTEITFRLLPRPETQGLMVIPLRSLEEARALVARIIDSNLQPLALEVVSPRLADIIAPSLGSASPAPPTGGGRPVLLAGYAGHPAARDRFVTDVSAWANDTEVALLSDEEAEPVYDALARFSAVARDGDAGGSDLGAGAQLKARAVVPVAEVWGLAGAATSLAARADMPLAFQVGAARGIVDLWLDPEAGSTDRGATAEPGTAPERDGMAAWVDGLRTAAAAAGGHLMVTDGLTRLPDGFDAWGDVGPSLRLMRAVKERFDPRRTLNPGRFVGGI